MVQLLRLLCGALIGLFQSSARREAEILVLRQQINMLRRKSPKRPALNNADRLLFVWLSRLVPTTLAALAVISPQNGDPLAPRRLPSLLALTIKASRWPTKDVAAQIPSFVSNLGTLSLASPTAMPYFTVDRASAERLGLAANRAPD
jgi:hypothetical protein